jgi:hypothetical protein
MCSGFSKSIKLLVSYSTPLKINFMHTYGFTDSHANDEWTIESHYQ